MTRSSDCWYVDSSVALRIHLRHSPAAIAWFNERLDAGDRMISSHLMLVEVVQVCRREGLDLAAAYDFVALFDLAAIDERLAREAARIDPYLKALDAIHIATALRFPAGAVALVTHDKRMAEVAAQLGLGVLDPVTD